MACSAPGRHGSQFVGGRTDKSLQGRIVGFGNGPDPPPLPDDYEVVWDEVESALGTLYESTKSGVDSVFEAFGLPSLLEDNKPQMKGKKFPSDNAASDSTDFKGESTGAYRVVANSVIVSATLELGGPCVTNLSPGDEVAVTKLARCGTRIRARITEPAGWISLVDAKSGQRWAEKKNGTEKTSADERSVSKETTSQKRPDTTDPRSNLRAKAKEELPAKKPESKDPRMNLRADKAKSEHSSRRGDEATASSATQPQAPPPAQIDDLIDMDIPSQPPSQSVNGGLSANLISMQPPPKSDCPLQVSAQFESEFGLTPAEASFASFESAPSTAAGVNSQAPIDPATAEPFAVFDAVSAAYPAAPKGAPLQSLSHHTPRGLALFDPVASSANEPNTKDRFMPVQRGLSIFDPLSDKSMEWNNAFGN